MFYTHTYTMTILHAVLHTDDGDFRLYIIEGLITIVWAAICLFVVPKNFETAYFLSEKDKVVMRRRAEVMASYSGGRGHYKWKDIKMAAVDVKSWVHGVIQICVVTILYGGLTLPSGASTWLILITMLMVFKTTRLTRMTSGFGTFLPIILKDGFHYSTIQAQYLVIPGT